MTALEVAPDPATIAELADGRTIRGWVDEGFGPVADAFRANFEGRGDLGSACAVYRGGRAIVDVWGGTADRRTGRPWDPGTAAVIFSCSKGIVAICVYLLVQAGRLDLDLPIATWWPAFAANGKDRITLRDAMSHRAGLAALDARLSRDEALAWEPVVRAIERQAPAAAPQAGHFYHAMTYGWIVGEVIRRVTGVTPGRWFRAAVAEPLALRTWIGLPGDAADHVAWMEPPLPDEDSAAARESARLAEENRLVERSLTMGGAWGFPVEDGLVSFNDPAIQAAEVPAANGISTARSLGRLYACSIGGQTPLLSSGSIADALVVMSAGPQLSGMPDDGARWGTGFQLSSPPSQPMLGDTSFGHAGAGGQLAFADVEHRVGFAYLSNQMGGYGDVRARELTSALRRALGRP
ncbi:MAG TPA: serine hydrolase domain-containing protein [Candidatus Limnocylindrales bacterium]|nr:serine hydrolase domain-containing protein [Candidatus Limnocylindrales bacterium]